MAPPRSRSRAPRATRLPGAGRRALTCAPSVILLEFAAQGVRGVAPPGGRATLRPGYNVVAADGAGAAAPARGAPPPGPARRGARSRAPAAARPARRCARGSRSSATTASPTGSCATSPRAASSTASTRRRRAFALVSQELAGDPRASSSDTVGVPPPARLSALLALSAAELPVAAGNGAAAGAPAGAARRALARAGRKRRDRAARGGARAGARRGGPAGAASTRCRRGCSAARGGAAGAATSCARGSSARSRRARELDGAAAVAAGARRRRGEARRLRAGERAARRGAREGRPRSARRWTSVEARGAPGAVLADRAVLAGRGAAALVARDRRARSPPRGARSSGTPRCSPCRRSGGRRGSRSTGSARSRTWERVARRRRVVDEWEKQGRWRSSSATPPRCAPR